MPLDVKVGDRILFGKWSGTDIKLDGEDLLIKGERRHGRHRGRGHARQESRLIFRGVLNFLTNSGLRSENTGPPRK